MSIELKQQQDQSNMPPQLRRYLETCSPDVLTKIWNYLDGDPRALDEMIDVCAKRATKEAHKKQPVTEPAWNQHPKYEQWKSICPKCDSIHTRHVSGSAEFSVTLQCTDCGHQFTLKEGFEAQLAKEKK
jgi:Zn finger protein HypA/HybF involved in hydrogenase expression